MSPVAVNREVVMLINMYKQYTGDTGRQVLNDSVKYFLDNYNDISELDKTLALKYNIMLGTQNYRSMKLDTDLYNKIKSMIAKSSVNMSIYQTLSYIVLTYFDTVFEMEGLELYKKE